MTTRRTVLVLAWVAVAGCGWTDTPESAQPIPPAALRYGANPATYTKGVAIPPNSPRSSGGAVKTYAVAPALPDGLALDPATGVLSGVPGSVVPRTAYVVTATNAYGSTETSLDVTVNDAPPSGLAYGLNPAVYTQGVAIAPNAPSSSGGAATSYAVDPPLPAGLGLETATGILSGTPTGVAPRATYTVTASNVSGSASVPLVIEVQQEAPAGLSYGGVPASFVRGVAIAPLTPTLAAGVPESFSVSPPLPAGIGLNTGTGVIDGTPTRTSDASNYTITATNGSGSTTAVLSFSVVDHLPTVTYSANPATYRVGVAITPNTPTASGGAVDSWSLPTLAPLPPGLSLNSSTGAITGTPTTVNIIPTPYVVIATNTGAGSVAVTLTITVTP